MQNFDPTSDKISRYLAGKMTDEGLAAFNEQLKADPELKEEVAFRKMVMESVKSQSNEQLRAQINTVVKEAHTLAGQSSPGAMPARELSNRTAKVISLNRRILSIAASVLILILLGASWYANRQFSNDSLVASNFELKTPTSNLRGENNDETDFNNDVMKAYSNKDFHKAAELLASIPPSPIYNKAQFHLGNLYLKLNNPSRAIVVFQNLLKKNDPRYQEEVQWLLCLAHLKNNDVKQTTQTLESILQNQEHSFYSNALQLKKKLYSPWRKIVF